MFRVTISKTQRFSKILFLTSLLCAGNLFAKSPLPKEQPELHLCYWQGYSYTNFGDYLSKVVVERMINQPVSIYQKTKTKDVRKLLAIGSIVSLADDNDVVWGSGIKGGGSLSLNKYRFKTLDVRAVRGPITRNFLKKNFNINCPEVYGDPALLLPVLFPEFKRPKNPAYEYVIIPHYSELSLFPTNQPNVISTLDPWDTVVRKILNSKFVISSSLHGVIVAEAFGIPARLLRNTAREPLLKFKDYYLGTQRPHFKIARSIEEALQMGGEPPMMCDLKKLYESFPFEFWGLTPKEWPK